MRAAERSQEIDVPTEPTPKASKPRTVQVLSAVIVNGPKDSWPIELYRQDLGIFSSLARAEQYLRKCLADDTLGPMYDDPDYPVVLYDLCERVLDIGSYDSHGRTRIYEREGALRGSEPYFTSGPRGARPTAGFRFRVGDLVECDVGKVLALGIVASPPLTPEATRAFWEPSFGADPERLEEYSLGEPYTILFEGEGNHQHLEECHLAPPRFPVPEIMEARLWERLGEYLAASPCEPLKGLARLMIDCADLPDNAPWVGVWLTQTRHDLVYPLDLIHEHRFTLGDPREIAAKVLAPGAAARFFPMLALEPARRIVELRVVEARAERDPTGPPAREHVFRADGTYMGVAGTSTFAIGDLVQHYRGGRLVLGIVVSLDGTAAGQYRVAHLAPDEPSLTWGQDLSRPSVEVSDQARAALLALLESPA